MCESFNFVVSGKGINISVDVDVKSFYIVKWTKVKQKMTKNYI